MTHHVKNDDISRAEQDVTRHRVELSKSLRQVGRSSEKLAQRVGSELKPALTIAAVGLGTVAAIGVTVTLLHRAHSRRSWAAHSQPTFLGNAAKAAGLWALRFVAQHVARTVVARLNAQPASEDASTATLAAAPPA